MDKEIAKTTGLTEVGKDYEGENQFIGTDKQWKEAEQLETKCRCDGGMEFEACCYDQDDE